MRHSLAQLLASPSGSKAPKEPAEEAAFFDDEDEEEGLLSPSELDLDWLEASLAAEALESGGGGGGPAAESQAPKKKASDRLKAAAAARLNRQKKKQYVSGLETRLQGLSEENRRLKERNRGLCRRLRSLERESRYLRAVLANHSALGRLLGRLAGGGGRIDGGLRVRSSLFLEEGEGDETPPSRESSASSSSSDHDYALPLPEGEEEEIEEDKMEAASVPASSSFSPSGICLHVDQDQVSVEFCSICSRRAAASSSSFKIFSFRCLPCQAPLCRG